MNEAYQILVDENERAKSIENSDEEEKSKVINLINKIQVVSIESTTLKKHQDMAKSLMAYADERSAQGEYTGSKLGYSLAPKVQAAYRCFNAGEVRKYC